MTIKSIKRVIIDENGKRIGTINRPMGFAAGPQEAPQKIVKPVTKRRPRDRTHPDFPKNH